MRAMLVREFGGPDVMRLENVPTPKPGPSDVLVRVRAAGVNPVDTYIRAGTYPRKPTPPYIPGMDGAGQVESFGADIVDLAHGDRVYIAGDNVAPPAGTYAEYALCSRTQLHRLPPRVSFGQGAAMGVPYATAYRALFIRAKADRRKQFCARRHGGVGIAAVQIARAHGMKVIGSGGPTTASKSSASRAPTWSSTTASPSI